VIQLIGDRPSRDDRLAHAYLTAKENILQLGYAQEVDWQHDADLGKVTESSFLKEAAWVILCAGFNEAVIRKKFRAVSHAFLDWTSASRILAERERCRREALQVFRSARKISAIIQVVQVVQNQGFTQISRRLHEDPAHFIQTLPYMGAVTSLHLAKNLGIPAVKPDRHLMRLAAAARCASPQELCERISGVVGDKIAVIDLVLWRYATLNHDYTTLFRLH
jgi:hypothetical protein